jgi:hypothetical protein
MARTGFLDQFARVLGPTRLDDQVGHVHRGAGAHGLPGRSAAGGGLQLGDVLADVGFAGRRDHWGVVGRHGDRRQVHPVTEVASSAIRRSRCSVAHAISSSRASSANNRAQPSSDRSAIAHLDQPPRIRPAGPGRGISLPQPDQRRRALQCV